MAAKCSVDARVGKRETVRARNGGVGRERRQKRSNTSRHVNFMSVFMSTDVTGVWIASPVSNRGPAFSKMTMSSNLADAEEVNDF